MGWLKRARIRRRRRRLVTQLHELGFYRYAPASNVEALKKDFIQNGWTPLYDLFHGTRRIFQGLYKEDLEPGWMKQVLRPFAETIVLDQSARLDPIEKRLPGSTTLRIDEKTWSIEFSTHDEISRKIAERQLLLNAANDLLQRDGSQDRLFFAWGEKAESVYLLLTPAQRTVILESGLMPDGIETTVRPLC